MKKIKVRECVLTKGKTGKIEIIYIPDQDQMLIAGQEYLFVLPKIEVRK